MPFTIQDILTLRSLPTESVGIFSLKDVEINNYS